MPELKTEADAQDLQFMLQDHTGVLGSDAMPDEQRPDSWQVEITVRGRRPTPALWRTLGLNDWTVRTDACGTRTGENGVTSTLVAVAPGGQR